MSQIKGAITRGNPREAKRVLNIRGGDVGTDTANFGGILSGSNDTVQSALDTIDDIFNADVTVNGDITLTSTDAGAGVEPQLTLYRNSSSPAVNDFLGGVRWFGEDSASNVTTYARITARIDDPTNGSEDAHYIFQVIRGGSLQFGWLIGDGIYAGGATGGDKGADTVNASGLYIDGDSILSGIVPGGLIAIIEDQKSSGTNGGTFSSGSDQTRDLNTLVYNRGSTVSLASNQFTLPAGDWEIEWEAPAHNVAKHQSLLHNASDTSDVKRGMIVRAPTSNVGNFSSGSARVSIGSSKAFEIRHVCQTSATTDGFGSAGSFGTEVYTRVVIRRG